MAIARTSAGTARCVPAGRSAASTGRRSSPPRAATGRAGCRPERSRDDHEAGRNPSGDLQGQAPSPIRRRRLHPGPAVQRGRGEHRRHACGHRLGRVRHDPVVVLSPLRCPRRRRKPRSTSLDGALPRRTGTSDSERGRPPLRLAAPNSAGGVLRSAKAPYPPHVPREQVVLNENRRERGCCPTPNGLEPSTPSLPCWLGSKRWQPVATVRK